MQIRKIQKSDTHKYLDFLLKLDTETKSMMYEPGERPTDISVVERISLYHYRYKRSLSKPRNRKRAFFQSKYLGKGK